MFRTVHYQSMPMDDNYDRDFHFPFSFVSLSLLHFTGGLDKHVARNVTTFFAQASGPLLPSEGNGAVQFTSAPWRDPGSVLIS